MNTRKPCPYTDEEILAMERVPARVAARYLKITYESLTWQLRQDAERETAKVPFGKARFCKRWVYDIFPQALVNFKNGYQPENEAIKKAEFMELFKKLDNNGQNQVKGFMKALIKEAG